MYGNSPGKTSEKCSGNERCFFHSRHIWGTCVCVRDDEEQGVVASIVSGRPFRVASRMKSISEKLEIGFGSEKNTRFSNFPVLLFPSVRRQHDRHDRRPELGRVPAQSHRRQLAAGVLRLRCRHGRLVRVVAFLRVQHARRTSYNHRVRAQLPGTPSERSEQEQGQRRCRGFRKGIPVMGREIVFFPENAGSSRALLPTCLRRPRPAPGFQTLVENKSLACPRYSFHRNNIPYTLSRNRSVENKRVYTR